MRRYYDNKRRATELYEEMVSWLGTPFKHSHCVKGKGVDCLYFVKACVEHSGGFQDKIVNVPRYAKDWGQHTGENRMLAALRTHYVHEYEEKEFDEKIDNGDIVLFHYGKQSCHLGIYYEKEVFQCLAQNGVRRIAWNSPDFRKRVTHVFAIYEKEEIS